MKASLYDRSCDVGVASAREPRAVRSAAPAVSYGLRQPKEPRAHLCLPLSHGQGAERRERRLCTSRETP